MVALPLRLEGLDGSPARVVLLKEEECRVMDLIVESVKKIEEMLANCGCEEGDGQS